MLWSFLLICRNGVLLFSGWQTFSNLKDCLQDAGVDRISSDNVTASEALIWMLSLGACYEAYYEGRFGYWFVSLLHQHSIGLQNVQHWKGLRDISLKFLYIPRIQDEQLQTVWKFTKACEMTLPIDC